MPAYKNLYSITKRRLEMAISGFGPTGKGDPAQHLQAPGVAGAH